MTNILISNDDGIHAPGIGALYQALERGLSDEYRLFIIAPDSQRSATGHWINFFNPVRIQKIEDNQFAIDGSPADCVKIAEDFLGESIDLVLSGINHGPNMGVDVYYSGTVAAAREAVINNTPAIALSLNRFQGQPEFSFVANFAVRLLDSIIPDLQSAKLLANPFFLNINIPDRKAEDIRGLRFTKLGQRIYKERLDLRRDPYNRQYMWVACDGITHKDVSGSDLNAVADGYISITPLSLDSTDQSTLAMLNEQRQSAVIKSIENVGSMENMESVTSIESTADSTDSKDSTNNTGRTDSTNSKNGKHTIETHEKATARNSPEQTEPASAGEEAKTQ